MSFDNTKNVIINGLILFFGLSFLRHSISKRVRACNCGAPDAVAASSTMVDYPKYLAPSWQNNPVVTRKSVAFYTARG